jgi:hypothetical protein
VPLTFDPYVPEFRLSGVTVPSRFMVERAGGPVPQLRSPWSHLIADADHAPEGFQQIACFPAEARADESAVCLFRRPEGCR